MDYLNVAQQIADIVVFRDSEDKIDYKQSYSHLFSFAIGLVVGSSISTEKVKELLEANKPVEAKE